MNFNEFPLHAQLQRAITAAGYVTPTPIQLAALPVALEGHDIVGTAQTGTGKTAAFVLPILHRLLANPPAGRKTPTLILTPTRELAEQIHDVICQLSQYTRLRSATVYGGVGMAPQEQALRNGTEIIVACPGRLLDHAERGNVNFDGIDCLVLDEADRMLDMGFLPSITRIIGMLPSARQTMLFSATFAPELGTFVKKALRAPRRIEMGIVAPATTVEHALYPVPQHLKTSLLMALLQQMDTRSVLIFTRTKHRANRIKDQLIAAGYNAGVLHSNKSQKQRQLALDSFRDGQLDILVATDIAARGIDVATISHVINYDVPDCADSYIHRIGRTGRAERDGEALTFITPADNLILRDIERAVGTQVEQRRMQGFDYTKPAPRGDEFARPPRPSRSHPAPAKTPISQPKHTARPPIDRSVRAAAPGAGNNSRNAPYGTSRTKPQPAARPRHAGMTAQNASAAPHPASGRPGGPQAPGRKTENRQRARRW